MRSYFVYILECADHSYYTGITNDLERRVAEHEAGFIAGCYTHTRQPVCCAFSREFKHVEEAIRFEKQIKGWTRRKKEALIRSDFGALVRFSRSHGSTSSP